LVLPTGHYYKARLVRQSHTLTEPYTVMLRAARLRRGHLVRLEGVSRCREIPVVINGVDSATFHLRRHYGDPQCY
jgi:hypothetical protein